MNKEQRQAYEWAKNQDYPSVAAKYAKILAGLIDEMTPPNEPLTLEELREMDAPVWCSCKTIEGWDGYWCLCQRGHIITPSGNAFDVKEIQDWVFYSFPPEGEGGA